MKKLRLFIVLLTFCFLFAACSGGNNGSPSSSDPPSSAAQSDDTSKEDPEQTVFIRPEVELVEDEMYLYYFNQADNRNLYKRNKSTGAEKVLFKTSRGFAHHLALLGERLYFVTNSEQNIMDSWLMSVDKNGGEVRKELNNVEEFLISEDTIYYTTFADETTGDMLTLYRYDCLTGESVQLSDGGCLGLNFMNGKLYYTQIGTGKIFCYDPSEERSEAIPLPEEFFSINYPYAQDGVLLFSGINLEKKLYGVFRYDIQTGVLKQLTDRTEREDGMVPEDYGVVYRNLNEFYTVENLNVDEQHQKHWVIQYKNGIQTVLREEDWSLPGCSYGLSSDTFYLITTVNAQDGGPYRGDVFALPLLEESKDNRDIFNKGREKV